MKNIVLSLALLSFFGTYSQEGKSYLSDLNLDLERNDFSSAQRNWIKASEVDYGKDTSSLIEYLLKSGDYNLRIGSFSQAMTFFEKALGISVESHNVEKKIESAKQLSIALWKTGNRSAADEQLKMVQNFYEDQKNELELAKILNNRGLLWSDSDIQLSLELYNRALQLYEKNGNSEDQEAITLNNIAIVQKNKGQFFDAIDNFEKVRTIWKQSFGDESEKIAFLDANIGQAYVSIHNDKTADVFLNHSIEIYEKLFKGKHPELANMYNYLSNEKLNDGSYEKAKEYNQKAFFSNQNSGNEVFDHLLNISILEEKAEILIQQYNRKSLNPVLLRKALVILDSCSYLIENQRKILINKDDKIALGRKSNEINEMAIECLLILKDEFLSQRKEYHQRILNYIEKSKSAALLASVQNSEAFAFSGIPQELLDKEKVQIANINFLEHELLKSAGSENNLTLQELIKSKKEYQNFIASLEELYPNYYDLKYKKSELKIEEIQSQLNDNELVVNYFISKRNNKVIALNVSKDKTWITKKDKHENFEKWIYAYLSGIKFSNYDVFNFVSNKIYQGLGLNQIPQKFKRLIIIPHGVLFQIPFESLVVKQNKEAKKFSQLDYLVQTKEVTYHFSSALWSKKHSIKYEKSATLFNPVLFDSFSLNALEGSKKETEELSELFKNQEFDVLRMQFGNASETNFKEKVKTGGKILHLPTHGMVNVSQPELSSIFLSPDTENDGILHSGEIYSLNLPFELVTLSACETGNGKVLDGEGLVGLSRALLYAGAQNVVVSFWTVNDESTAELMINFYKNNLDKAFPLALTESKRKMIENEKFSSPYFWAAFVLIGK